MKLTCNRCEAIFETDQSEPTCGCCLDKPVMKATKSCTLDELIAFSMLLHHLDEKISNMKAYSLDEFWGSLTNAIETRKHK